MPELPEVETVRRSLAGLAGRRVAREEILRPDVLRSADGCGLAGGIVALHRRGKQLAIECANGRVLVIHLGMSGQVRLGAASPMTHVHARWVLDDGGVMEFRDPRRFGGLWALSDAAALAARWEALGPDALEARGDDLRRRAGRSTRAIKAALLDQQVLAGVGNIYADEALFEARIRPQRRCVRVSGSEWERVASSVRLVLERAIAARGSTLRDYRDASGAAGEAQLGHAVYGRGGAACVRCGKSLRSMQVAQRTTCYCPGCQR